MPDNRVALHPAATGLWKPIPLIQERACAPTDLSSHQNSDDLANEGNFFCACYQYGRFVRERAGLEETDFFVLSLWRGSPHGRLTPCSPSVFAVGSCTSAKLQRSVVGFCGKRMSYSKAAWCLLCCEPALWHKERWKCGSLQIQAMHYLMKVEDKEIYYPGDRHSQLAMQFEKVFQLFCTHCLFSLWVFFISLLFFGFGLWGFFVCWVFYFIFYTDIEDTLRFPAV